jgi:hypothetical protein
MARIEKQKEEKLYRLERQVSRLQHKEDVDAMLEAAEGKVEAAEHRRTTTSVRVH